MHFTTAICSLALVLPLALAQPTNLRPRYDAGWCGLHVTQWQKNENGVGGDYQFDLAIKDANGNDIGGVSRLPIGGTGSVSSQLPYTVDIQAGQVDDDPITFHYSGQTFSTSDGQCSVGAYDSGNRQGDCGFTC